MVVRPVNQARDSAPFTPVPVKYCALARKVTLRGVTIGITNESAKERWLLATMTGPSGGMLSRPSTVGRQIALASGGTTAWVTSYNMRPAFHVDRVGAGSGGRVSASGSAAAPAAQPPTESGGPDHQDGSQPEHGRRAGATRPLRRVDCGSVAVTASLGRRRLRGR